MIFSLRRIVLNTMNLLTSAHSKRKRLIQFALIIAFLILSGSYSHAQSSDTVQVRITANPAQSFMVCARELQLDESVILVAKDDPPDKPASTTFITTQPQTSLLLFLPHRCTPEQTQQHPYSEKGGIYSESPFVVDFLTGDKKKKHHKHKALSEQGLLFPFNPPAQHKLSDNGGGSFGPDDDDQQHRRPYGYFQETSGDIDLTLLSSFQLPQVLGDYLPDHISWQAVMSLMCMGNSESHVMWVYPENQPAALTSIQVNTDDIKELTNNLAGEQSINWLIPKLRLDHGKELIQQLLQLQDVYSDIDSVFSEPVLALIRERLVEVFDNPNTEIDLVFEQFRLRRDLQEIGEGVKERLLLVNRPDTGTVYDGGEVNSLIYQAGDKPPGSGKTQYDTGNGSAGGSDQSSGGDESKEQEQDEEEEVRSKNPGTVSRSSSQEVEPLRIVFFGRMSVGKSSLANLLIGYRHFTEMDGETKGSVGNESGETSFRSPELIIRSLAGYDGWNEDEDNYIERNDIKDSDIIIYVVDGPIKPTDKKYIRYFHDKGQRVVFVRNKYQTAMKALLKAAGYDESNITEDVLRSRNYQESYLDARKTIKSNFEKGYRKSLSGIEINDLPEVLLTECIEGGTFCDANLVTRIRGLLTPEESKLWRAFRGGRVAKKGSINSALLMDLKSYIETDNPELSLFDFLTTHLAEQYLVPEKLLPDKEKITTASNWHRAEEISQKLHDEKKTLQSLKNDVLVDATSTFKTTLLKTGAISAGGTGVMITINTILAVMAATPIDEAILVGLTSVAASSGGVLLVPIVGLPLLVAGGGGVAAWYGHKKWQEHGQRKQEIIISFSGLAVILEMFINETRQKHIDQIRWEQYEKEHAYDVIPERAEVVSIAATTRTQTQELPPSKPPRSKPENSKKAEPEQKDTATAQTEKQGRVTPKTYPLALTLASHIGKDQNQCKELVDNISDKFRNKVLKVLAREPLLLKDPPSSEQLFNSKFYSHGVIVPLLYATGIKRELIQRIQHADHIYATLKEGGFASVRYIMEGFLHCTGDCTKLFDAIEVSVAWINNPQVFANVMIAPGDKRQVPVIIYEMMADPIKREELVDLAKP